METFELRRLVPPVVAGLIAAKRRRKGDPGTSGAACPVTPDRPLNLSGGAAAAMEFDE